MADESPELFEIPASELEFADPRDRRVTVVYSNSAQVSVSSEDVSIGFGVRNLKDPKVTLVTTRVYMSHSHAKRLVGALSRGIEALEAQVGEIELNPGVERMKAPAREASAGERTESDDG